MTTLTNNIELNNKNTVDAETADLFFAMILESTEEVASLEDDVRELHKISKAVSEVSSYKDENGNITEEYRSAMTIYMESGKKFITNHGDDKFSTFRMYKTLSSRLDYVVNNKKVVRAYKSNKMNKETREY